MRELLIYRLESALNGFKTLDSATSIEEAKVEIVCCLDLLRNDTNSSADILLSVPVESDVH